MVIEYQQKCLRCRKNFVLVSSRKKSSRICLECQKKEMTGEIKDPVMKKLFDIPDEFYVENAFLRSIKINYLKYGSLTENQIDAFKKVAKKMQENSK